jgi:hypothetical protein
VLRSRENTIRRNIENTHTHITHVTLTHKQTRTLLSHTHRTHTHTQTRITGASHIQHTHTHTHTHITHQETHRTEVMRASWCSVLCRFTCSTYESFWCHVVGEVIDGRSEKSHSIQVVGACGETDNQLDEKHTAHSTHTHTHTHCLPTFSEFVCVCTACKREEKQEIAG